MRLSSAIGAGQVVVHTVHTGLDLTVMLESHRDSDDGGGGIIILLKLNQFEDTFMGGTSI